MTSSQKSKVTELPYLHIVWKDSPAQLLNKGAFTSWRNAAKELLFKGDIFSIPDDGPPVLATKQNSPELAERLLNYIDGGGTFDGVNGQFCSLILEGDSVLVYRSAFSRFPLYFNDSGLSDKLGALCSKNDKYSFDYLQRFVLDCPSLHFLSPLTPIEGIRRLAPETVLQIKEGCITHQEPLPFKSYTPISASRNSRVKMAELVRGKLQEILLWNLAKKRPIHAELSGGLDSAFVSSLLSDLNSTPIKAHMFSYRKHPSHEFSENCAKKVAVAKNISLEIFDAIDIPVPDLETEFTPYQNEPAETYWMGAIFGPLMRKNIAPDSLLFSGFGCDQLFMRGTEILPCLFRIGRYRELLNLLKDIAKSSQRSYLNLALQFLLSLLPRKHLAWVLDFTRNWRLNPFKLEELVPQILQLTRVEWMKQNENPIAYLYSIEEEGKHQEKRFFSENVPHANLDYLMITQLVLEPYFNSENIEYVHAFCDKRMIDFVFREVPWHAIHDFKSLYKQLLREAQKGIVPDEVRLRPHNDFSFDGYYYSLLGQNRRFLYDLLMNATVEFSDWIDAKKIAVSFEKMMLGSNGNSENTLARLLSYLIWRRQFSGYLE